VVEPYSNAAGVFGKRLRAIRTGLALSQEEVAHLAEIHPTNYGKLERGRANPNMETIIRISTVLGIEPGELLRGLTTADYPGRHHNVTAKEWLEARERMR
jgi:transcriptional regulator with XRE-family HTH domain